MAFSCSYQKWHYVNFRRHCTNLIYTNQVGGKEWGKETQTVERLQLCALQEMTGGYIMLTALNRGKFILTCETTAWLFKTYFNNFRTSYLFLHYPHLSLSHSDCSFLYLLINRTSYWFQRPLQCIDASI